jgi:hypothetical protein
MPGDDIENRESDFAIKSDSETVIFQPNHQLMARPALRGVDMRPQWVFFYKRLTDNKILCFSEQDAAMMEKSSHRFFLQRIGASDGRTYQLSVRNCGVKPGTVIPKIQAQKILDDAFQAELKTAEGNFVAPKSQNVHYDESFPIDQRSGFIPPP